MIPEKVSRILSTHGLQAIEFEPGSTATSHLAAGQLGVLVGQIAKSLLFLGKDGRYFMLLCPGDRKVSSHSSCSCCTAACSSPGSVSTSSSIRPSGGTATGIRFPQPPA